MSQALHLFIDFDDTLSDFKTLGARYVDNLTGILSAEMGGDRVVWAEAIQSSLITSVGRYLARFRNHPLGYNAWLEQERAVVVNEVFEQTGKESLSSEEA